MGSKAQAALAKIIAIIINDNHTVDNMSQPPSAGGVGIAEDLNLQMMSPEEEEEVEPTAISSTSSTAESAAEKCAVDQSTQEEEQQQQEEEKINNNYYIPADHEEEFELQEGSYLDLLLQAARKVEVEGSAPPAAAAPPPPPAAAGAGKREEEESESRAPSAAAVRSKRGRIRAMPSRYRDSVLEPWGKLPPVTRLGRSVHQI